jgi:2-keto-3-deoxy-L-fuconate dehydrogenase
VLDVNVVGTARVSRAAWPALRASSHAAVVNTCSVAATADLPRRAVYSASKAAVAALTRAMAADGMPDGIRVNAVNPGTAETQWVGRLLESAADLLPERAALQARQPHTCAAASGSPSRMARKMASCSSTAATRKKLCEAVATPR